MNNKDKLKINLLGVILACLQPIVWHIIWLLFATTPTQADRTPNVGLTFVCIISMIGCVIGIIYITGYIIKGKNPWDDD